MAGQLRATLSLTQLTFYGVGTVVGAGIYSIIGAAAGQVGEGMWVSMALAALAAFITALSYAELIAMYPRAGAEFHFLANAFPQWPLLPYAAGFLVALNAAATSAAVSVSFAEYLRVFVEVPVLLTALLLLLLCTAINILGLRESTWVSITLICIEVGGLLVLIAGGWMRADPFEAVRLPAGGQWPAVFAGAALMFFIYIGFESVVNLAEEAKQPKRDLPRALLLSVVITSLIYLLVAWAALALVGAEALAQSASPLERAGAAVHPRLGQTLAVTALFATASTALISLISVSRLLYGMAREDEFPRVVAHLLPGRKTPWVAALLLLLASVALLGLKKLETMASISALGLLLVFTGVQLTLIVLRYKEPERERPFRLPLNLGRLPLIPLLGIVATLALATQFEPVVYAVTAGTLLAAAGLRFLTANKKRQRVS